MENLQNVVVVLNPFQKLAVVRRCVDNGGVWSMDTFHARLNQPAQGKTRAVVKAMRKYPRDQWCQRIVSTELSVNQANDMIKWLNREYLSQGYKLLVNEDMI